MQLQNMLFLLIKLRVELCTIVIIVRLIESVVCQVVDGGDMIVIPKVRKFERNAWNEFEFVSLDSTVDAPYSQLPFEDSFVWDRNSLELFGDACEVQLDVNLIDFQQIPADTTVTLCLFQASTMNIHELFQPKRKLELFGNYIDPVIFYRRLHPVFGFVMGEFDSVVQGFLINETFFGSIRIFDPLPHHHILFYIEPFSNIALYLPQLNTLASGTETSILFEYVRHEADKHSSNANTTFETTLKQNILSQKYDIAERIRSKPNTPDVSSNPFDLRNDIAFACAICVWIEPIFAENFGLGAGYQHGVGEVINLLQFVQFVLQGTDFNGDKLADEFKIMIREVIVSDNIRIGGFQTSTPLNQSYGRDVYEHLRPQLVKTFHKKKCCAILGYIYENIAPQIAFSTLGGICSRSHNVGIISGYIHNHKIGKYDVYRYTLHTIGHLIGSSEEDMSNPICVAEQIDTPLIFNPPLMDTFHKIDIGIRPNSLRFSICAKLEIAAFLTTFNVNCLKKLKNPITRCGNGLIENGEECDCGLPWQCHLDEMEKPSCCGESDSILRCKKISGKWYRKDSHCHRPFTW